MATPDLKVVPKATGPQGLVRLAILGNVSPDEVTPEQLAEIQKSAQRINRVVLLDNDLVVWPDGRKEMLAEFARRERGNPEKRIARKRQMQEEMLAQEQTHAASISPETRE
jgi:hypothetical protein